MASGEGLEEGQVPCIKCGANAWPLQIAVGQQVYTMWLCPDHLAACRADFARWLSDWSGQSVPIARY